MKKTRHHLLTVLALVAASAAQGQELFIDFDNNRSGYGIRETSGTPVQLTLLIDGSPTAADNFDEMDNLAAATVTATGAALGASDPFTFTMAASAGDDMDIQGDGVDVSGAGFGAGETLTFIFGSDVVLTELDFDSIGAGEFAAVSIAGTGFTFGDTPGDSHAISQGLSAGSSLVFQFAAANPASYNLQGIGLSVVPEPSSCALAAGALALGLIGLRRRIRCQR